jgi:2-methylcitrate dehydratase PrpD
MGVTETLARLAIETPWEDIPAAAKESAKLRILDTVGIALAGADEPSTRIALDTARHMGGHENAAIIGRPDRTSAPLAAYVNATAAHAQEFDDYTKGVTHASVVMVPGALALADEKRLSGRDFMAGFITGFEIESRVARGIRPALLDRAWPVSLSIRPEWPSPSPPRKGRACARMSAPWARPSMSAMARNAASSRRC